MPYELPKVDGWEIAACFKAAHEVAGDFYDAFSLPDEELVCVVGDVCGKGVGAALFMTLFRSLIRATCTTDYFSSQQDLQALPTSERLQRVVYFTNRYIAETHAEANMFATVVVGIFDLKAGTLTYVNCGNEPPLLLSSDGRITTLQPTGPVVGTIPDAQFSVREIHMDVGSLVLAFTDGIPDALNLDSEFSDVLQR